MNYRVIKNFDQYKVIENKTNHTMKTFTKSHEAYKMCNQLNSGKGFDGWTPEFIIKKIDYYK